MESGWWSNFRCRRRFLKRGQTVGNLGGICSWSGRWWIGESISPSYLAFWLGFAFLFLSFPNLALLRVLSADHVAFIFFSLHFPYRFYILPLPSFHFFLSFLLGRKQDRENRESGRATQPFRDGHIWTELSPGSALERRLIDCEIFIQRAGAKDTLVEGST